MLTTATHRPRNVDAKRAGAILYGDWGTSKAYVIGLAFAIAGYASFWLIALVSLLSILVGINYITVCKYYPNGGGVYASVRHRSQIISMIGAFFLVADYLVTAALSGLSAAFYFGIGDPILFSCIAIFCIGILNYFGPKHVGTFAFFLVAISLVVLLFLAFISLPHLKGAWENIRPLSGSPVKIWTQFVGVIVALSGVEAIANATGVMTLDREATISNPSVRRTAKKAIISVMLEVAILTSLFGFVMAAIPNFELADGTVNAPGNPGVRDYMLKYLAEVFGTHLWGSQFGQGFALVVSIVIGLLLLSAVNTAINGLVSLQYYMASDGEVPKFFQKVNEYGVPLFPLAIATFVPIFLVATMRDVAGLSSLYAIGFVGAIATNLGSTSTDMNLEMKWKERSLMFFTFLVMAAVEITLFIDKPEARVYALIVIVCGLFLRGIAQEFKVRKIIAMTPKLKTPIQVEKKEGLGIKQPSILCAGMRPGRALDLAIEKSKKRKIPLHVLFLREQSVVSEADFSRKIEEDAQAIKLRTFVEKRTDPTMTNFYYAVTDSSADIIVAYALLLDATEIFLPIPKKGLQLLKGDVIREITNLIPDDVHLFVIP